MASITKNASRNPTLTTAKSQQFQRRSFSQSSGRNLSTGSSSSSSSTAAATETKTSAVATAAANAASSSSASNIILSNSNSSNNADLATTPVISNLGSGGKRTVSSSSQLQPLPPLELPQSALDGKRNENENDDTISESSTARFSSCNSPPIVLKQWPCSSQNNNHGSNTTTSASIVSNVSIPQTISVKNHSIRGIRNYGQTCFLNSVLQSLASLTAFEVYLNSHVRAARRMQPLLRLRYNEDEEDGLTDEEDCSSLYLTKLLSKGLQYINGAKPDPKWDPRLLLDVVAQSHKQFEASHQQQDAQELMTALLDVLVQEQEFQKPILKSRKRRGWLGTRLSTTPEPVATSFASAPPSTVWALSPAFMRLQLAILPTDEESCSIDDSTQQTWNDMEDDVLSVASSAREQARSKQKSQRQMQSTTTTSNAASSSAGNLAHGGKNSLKNNSTAVTSMSTVTHDDLGDNQNMEGEFEVHVPHVDSEDEVSKPLHQRNGVDVPTKQSLAQHLAKKRNIPEADHDSMSDLSSSVMTQQSSTFPSSQLLAHNTGSSNYVQRQLRAAERLSMPLCGWMGSTLQCRVCHYVRPIQNVPFVDISIVPTAVGDPFASKSAGRHARPCTVEECLSDFTKVERVEQVDCPSCTRLENMKKAQEEVAFWEYAWTDATAIQQKRQKQQGNTSTVVNGDESKNDELQSIREELDRHKKTLHSWQVINCDDDDSTEKISRLLGYNNEEKPANVLLRQDANKCLFLTRLPPVFCLHVQRRYYDPQTARLSKTTQPVLFDEFLNVAPYCAYTTSPPRARDGRHRQTADAAPSWIAGKSAANRASLLQQRQIFYRLMAVLEHRGGSNCGHYVCYRRTPSGEWYYISDHIVRQVSWQTVRQCQAYMLFYETTNISDAAH